jgi:putative membrane protein
VKDLVVAQRFIMYSLFIGLTLGGVPIVWRLARPMNSGIATGAAVGFIVMVLMALGQPASSGSAGPAYGLLFVAGLAGSSAMILPGVSGGYLLLLLGQYVPILSAVSDFKEALLSSPRDYALAWTAMKVGIPVGVGVVAGVVGVSNLLRWLLERFRKPTLGLLLGLLLGAVVGLWPFQRTVAPEPGNIIKGTQVTTTNLESFDPEDWPTARFSPSAAQVATSVGLIALGFAATQLLSKIGRKPREL